MKTIHAIYANGVFRPLERVDLPEASEVEFEPRAAPSDRSVSADEALPLSPLALEIEQFVQPETAGPAEA